MPVIQLDWLKIKGRLGDRTALFALTTAQASLLLSISEQLEWRKTYRAFGYDFSDWDYLQAEVADLQRGLMMPVYIDNLVGQLGQMTDAIISLYCCPDGTPLDTTGGDQFTDHYIEDEANGVPDNIITAGYASDDDDWDGFYEYKCMVSHVAVESLAQKLDQFEELADAGAVGMVSLGAILAVLGTVLGIVSAGTFVIVLGILGGAAAVANLYQKITSATEGLFADAAEEVRDESDALACALFQGDGPNDSYDDMIVKATELLTAPTVALIKLMNMKPDLKALYSGRYDQTDVASRLADLGYLVSSYDCSTCGEPDPPPGYHLEFPTAIGTPVWHSNTTNRVVTYDAPTGALHVSFDTLTGNQFELNLPMADADWITHGQVVKLVAYTGPTNAHGSPIFTSFPNAITIGDKAAGYRSDIHSGSAWDDWMNAFDVQQTYSPNPLDLTFFESPNQSAQGSTSYGWDFILRMLVPN